MVIERLFSRAWLPTTILVILASLVCIRLGIWQLNRLEGRRVFNTQVQAMRDLTELNLGIEQNTSSLAEMEWRAVTATGNYDYDHQVALRNQYHGEEYGYHLITPLILSNSMAILVDRGWIPATDNATPSDWRRYDEPDVVNVAGQIRVGSAKPAFGGLADPTQSSPHEKLEFWNNLDVMRISLQIPYPILNVYIQLNENANDQTPPIPYQPEVDLTEGPHFGYALQWFTFATILLIGYPFYLQGQKTKNK